MKMLGVLARVCDHKGCTCNPGLTSNRTRAKRTTKRRERAVWKKEAQA